MPAGAGPTEQAMATARREEVPVLPVVPAVAEWACQAVLRVQVPLAQQVRKAAVLLTREEAML